jgi:hypothetical protein
LISKVCLGQKMSRMDVLIRCPSTTIKRVRSAFPERYNQTLEESLQEINKEFWLIRRPNRRDRFQWTFLFGTNWEDVKNWKKLGLFRVDSADGQAILKEASYTRTERFIGKQAEDPSRPLGEGMNAVHFPVNR